MTKNITKQMPSMCGKRIALCFLNPLYLLRESNIPLKSILSKTRKIQKAEKTANTGMRSFKNLPAVVDNQKSTTNIVSMKMLIAWNFSLNDLNAYNTKPIRPNQ